MHSGSLDRQVGRHLLKGPQSDSKYNFRFYLIFSMKLENVRNVRNLSKFELGSACGARLKLPSRFSAKSGGRAVGQSCVAVASQVTHDAPFGIFDMTGGGHWGSSQELLGAIYRTKPKAWDDHDMQNDTRKKKPRLEYKLYQFISWIRNDYEIYSNNILHIYVYSCIYIYIWIVKHTCKTGEPSICFS